MKNFNQLNEYCKLTRIKWLNTKIMNGEIIKNTNVNFQPVQKANIIEPMISDKRRIKWATRKPIPSQIFSRSPTRQFDNSPKFKY